MKVVAAVGELEKDYGRWMDFNVIPAEVTAESQEEIEAFGFAELRHGLVVFDAAGDVAATLPGHQFGRSEIEAALQPLLSEN